MGVFKKSFTQPLTNTLYDYCHRGCRAKLYKGYKLISKHYINSNNDDNKLQEEIEMERIRRSLIKNKDKFTSNLRQK